MPPPPFSLSSFVIAWMSTNWGLLVGAWTSYPWLYHWKKWSTFSQHPLTARDPLWWLNSDRCGESLALITNHSSSQFVNELTTAPFHLSPTSDSYIPPGPLSGCPQSLGGGDGRCQGPTLLITLLCTARRCKPAIDLQMVTSPSKPHTKAPILTESFKVKLHSSWF